MNPSHQTALPLSVPHACRDASSPAADLGDQGWRRSCAGTRAVALVRDVRTVRLAFLALLVLGSPKALE